MFTKNHLADGTSKLFFTGQNFSENFPVNPREVRSKSKNIYFFFSFAQKMEYLFFFSCWDIHRSTHSSYPPTKHDLPVFSVNILISDTKCKKIFWFWNQENISCLLFSGVIRTHQNTSICIKVRTSWFRTRLEIMYSLPSAWRVTFTTIAKRILRFEIGTLRFEIAMSWFIKT